MRTGRRESQRLLSDGSERNPRFRGLRSKPDHFMNFQNISMRIMSHAQRARNTIPSGGAQSRAKAPACLRNAIMLGMSLGIPMEANIGLLSLFFRVRPGPSRTRVRPRPPTGARSGIRGGLLGERDLAAIPSDPRLA
jgi:hypothetical protein